MHLYVHIPFCRQNCSYCDFYFSVNKRHEAAFFAALRRELQSRAEEIRRYGPLQSIYFGGGTPSYADERLLAGFMAEIRALLEVAPEAEITLEANPEDITRSHLSGWKALGINRISVGIQSFDDTHLRLMNRSHDAAEARRALDLLAAEGPENVTMDLIYGIPGQTAENWRRQLSLFLDYAFPHLSAYALTVEEGTLLHRMVQKGRIRMPADEDYETAFRMLHRTLEKNGWEHYEISNFARPGYRSRHNTAYWQGHPYTGLGPSAHSYDGRRLRRWNVANLHRYIRGLEKGEKYYETETLADRDRYNEYIMTGLRMKEGVAEEEIRKSFPAYYENFRQTAEDLAAEGLLVFRAGHWFIPENALFRTDGIVEVFIVV